MDIMEGSGLPLSRLREQLDESVKDLYGGCSWFTQTQESGVGYCSLKNHEREVFDTEYCSWGAWTAKEG